MRTLLLAMAVLTLSACVSTNSIPLGTPSTYAAVPAEQVRVFLTEADVPGEFEKLALINAKGESSWTDEEQMIRAMQKEAGKLGANAIILGEFKEPSAGAKVAGAFLGTSVERKGQVLAIRIVTPPATDEKP